MSYLKFSVIARYGQDHTAKQMGNLSIRNIIVEDTPENVSASLTFHALSNPRRIVRISASPTLIILVQLRAPRSLTVAVINDQTIAPPC